MLDGMVEVLERRRTAPLGDRGLIVSIVSWVLLVAMVSSMLARFGLKFAVCKNNRRRIGLDDVFIIFAALFSIGQTTAVSVSSVSVLGQHIESVTPAQVELYGKTEYAACLLYLANMGCARISVCFLIAKILPGKPQQYVALSFAILSILWSISGILVTAFPCDLPKPWKYFDNNCINMTKFVNYTAISNVVLEFLLIFLPLFVWNLRLQTTGRRLSISMLFLSRLTIVISVICQLIYFNRYARSTDHTYDYWRTTLCVQITQNLSIITACIPYFHPFVLSIFSGATNPSDLAYRTCPVQKKIEECLRGEKSSGNDSIRSSSSSFPIRDGHYVAPLATYGLDQTSRSNPRLVEQMVQHNPNTVTNQPSNSNPVSPPAPSAAETIFNRMVSIPCSRPSSNLPASKSSSQSVAPPPKSLSQVGVLPMIDYDTDSDRNSNESPTRIRDEEYLFPRQPVMSIPEEEARLDGRHSVTPFFPPPSEGGEKRR